MSHLLSYLWAEGLRHLAGSLHFRSLLPPVKRVRRRGFRRDVRRGDDVRLASGETWRVVKRSPWNLWVEPIQEFEPRTGSTIQIRLPKRYAVSPQPEAAV